MAKKDLGGVVERRLRGKTHRYEVLLKEEDLCLTCIHSDVCSFDMSKLCVNYCASTSSEDQKSCHCCIHRYARWDPKEPIPCFKCPAHEERTEITGFWKILADQVVIATCTEKWKIACLKAVPGATAYICSEFWHEHLKKSRFGVFVGSNKAVQKLKEEEAEHAKSGRGQGTDT